MKFTLSFFIALFIGVSMEAQTFQWAKRMGSTSSDYSKSVITDDSGNVYTAGVFRGTADFDPGVGVYNLISTPNSYDVFIQKLDSAGNFIWAVTFGGNSTEDVSCITRDLSGNIYITGVFNNDTDFDPGPGIFNLTCFGTTDIFINKLDPSGGFLWAKQMGGTLEDNSLSIFVDANKNVYTTGYFKGTADFEPGLGLFNLTSLGNEDIFISKLDSNGIFVWAKSMGSASSDESQSIAVDQLGNVYTAGLFYGTTDFDPNIGVFNLSASSSDVFISKLDANGAFVWAKQIGGTQNQEGKSIRISPFGDIYIAGKFRNTVDFDPGAGTYYLTNPINGANYYYDAFVLKLNANGGFIWAKQLGGGGIGNDLVWDMVTDINGNVYTAGETGGGDFDPNAGNFNLSSGLFISKLDSSGAFLWAKRCVAQKVYSIAQDNMGSIYTAGYFASTIDFNPGLAVFNLVSLGADDAYICKFSTCGYLFNQSYTSCDSINLNGTTYTASGHYNQLYTTVNGCDSIFKYYLSIPQTIVMNYTALTVCDSITMAGQTYTTSGLYYPVYTSINTGCDSILTIGLTVNNSTANSISVSGCSPYTINGQTYNATGVYTQNLTNAAGCDSILTINYTATGTVNNITLNQIACSSYTLNGQTYNASGTYTQNYLNVNGCDSIITLNLTINQPTANTITQTACVSYTLNGQTYNSSGTYTQTLVNAAGCDSVITLNLTINQPTANTINQTACTSYILNGQTYNSSGIYTQTLVNAVNCDSVITLNLTINQPSTNTITQTACNSYTLNGQTYNTTGTYTQTLVNAVNCDSVITLNLTINTVNTAVTQTGSLLTATATPATYQWLRCNPYQDLPGETNQSFTANANGDYAVAVTQNGCSDTSICYTVIGIGMTDYLQASNIILYPNPVTQQLTIEDEKSFQYASIKIFTVAGQMVLEQSNISDKKITLDLAELVSGIYFVEIEDGGYKSVRLITKQ